MSKMNKMNKIELPCLPIKCKNNTDLSSLYDCHTVAVAIQYCVLRSKTKEYT